MINTKIEITTPPEKETMVLLIFKHLFLKISGVWKAETYTDTEQNKIYLELQLTPKQYTNVIRNIGNVKIQFENFWHTKLCQNTIKNKPPQEVKELKDALLKNTKIRIINKTESETLLNEYYQNTQLTMWQKIKNKLKKENKQI